VVKVRRSTKGGEAPCDFCRELSLSLTHFPLTHFLTQDATISRRFRTGADGRARGCGVRVTKLETNDKPKKNEGTNFSLITSLPAPFHRFSVAPISRDERTHGDATFVREARYVAPETLSFSPTPFGRPSPTSSRYGRLDTRGWVLPGLPILGNRRDRAGCTVHTTRTSCLGNPGVHSSLECGTRAIVRRGVVERDPIRRRHGRGRKFQALAQAVGRNTAGATGPPANLRASCQKQSRRRIEGRSFGCPKSAVENEIFCNFRYTSSACVKLLAHLAQRCVSGGTETGAT
jgi:hypothetical protein